MSGATADGPVVALDVGGSAMKGAVLDEHSQVVGFHRWPTPRSDGPDAVIGAVLGAVDELLRHAEGAAPKPGGSCQIIGPAIDDESAQFAFMHCFLQICAET